MNDDRPAFPVPGPSPWQPWVMPPAGSFRGEVRPGYREFWLLTRWATGPVFLVLPAVAIAVYLLFSVVYRYDLQPSSTSSLVLMVLAVVLFAVLPEFAIARAWKQNTRNGPFVIRYVISPDRLEITTPTTAAVFASSEVVSVRRGRRGWVLRIRSSRVGLFRAAFTAADAAGVDRLFHVA